MKKLIIGLLIGLVLGSALTFGITKIVENTTYNKDYKALQQLVLDYNEALQNEDEFGQRQSALEEEYTAKYGKLIIESYKYDTHPHKVVYKHLIYDISNTIKYKEKTETGYSNWTQETCDKFYQEEKKLYEEKMNFIDVSKEVAKFNLKYSKQYYLEKQGGYYYLGDKAPTLE